ncbi:MAG: alpha-L-arabinofuranosidase C-terminal domain-containing protein [Verrucomicrobiota bacterium]|jgi:alpha-N-arabinofuranosidase
MRTQSLIVCVCLLFICTSLSAQITVKIDPQKTGTPISKYIYSQFIEHVGRSVNGGLWAEMVVDRKFFFPITDDFNPWGTAEETYFKSGPFKFLNASPWKVVGLRGTVSMDTNNPYVGKQSPVIHLPGDGTAAGISEAGLGVVKGKKYTGHIVLAGDESALPIEVRLVLDDGTVLSHSIKKITAQFQLYPFRFTAQALSTNVQIEIVSRGKGAFKIGILSLMPADNLKGWRSDVVALLKKLDSPLYRWPGGNFVSGYDWKVGIGPDRDKRAPMKNPAWWGIEPNDVGIDEFMELMHLIDAEPYVALNTGLGTLDEALAEVQYFNGSVDTPMGKWRAQNGHPEPYGVKFWAVGNEMFGSWQLGHMPVDRFVKTNNIFADAIWKADPGAQLVAVGNVGDGSDWSKVMLENCSDHMNFISEHIYSKEKTNVVDHARQLAEQIRQVAEIHRKYREEIPGLAAKNIRIAMDEWNYWHGSYFYGELGVRYYLKDGLGVAEGLHEFYRNSDLFYIADYAQAVNALACIKATTTAAAFESTGLVLELYRNHFGSIPIAVSGAGNNLDVSAAWTDDKKAITVAIVNPNSIDEPVSLDLNGVSLAKSARRWVIINPNPESYNEPGKAPNIIIGNKMVTIKNSSVVVPPYSVSLYRLEIH